MRIGLLSFVIALTAWLPAAFAAEEKPQGPPPSLEGVTWDDQPVSYAGLRGKAVVVLAYATWAEDANGQAIEMFRQLKAAIDDKPVVVLAINADKQSGKGRPFMKTCKFTGPNIVHGWDALMPARMEAKHDVYVYAAISPDGQVIGKGQALGYYNRPEGKAYVVGANLARMRNLGQFALIEPSMAAGVKTALWPLEIGRSLSEAELKQARQGLKDADLRTFDVAVDKYLDQEVTQIRKLAQGEPAERLLAYDRATRLATNFKSRDKAKPAKEVSAELNQDVAFRQELAAKKAYEKTLLSTAKTPDSRGKLLAALARQYKGTVYGQRAADESKSTTAAAAPARPKSIRTWPELTDAQQEAALTKQRAFLDELKQKVPGRGLQSYETEHFLFYSDLPGNIITTSYLPYLDKMYVQLCGAFGLDPAKNHWKGKATIVAYVNEADFHSFEQTFYGDPHQVAQGTANLHGDGTVRIGCHAGADPLYFASVLVHETAHGFNWRYRSGDHIPSWLDEGAAEWIANRVVTTDKAVQRKVERAIKQMKQTRSLGGNFFTADHIVDWQYGAAASMTDFLLNYEPPAAGKSTTRSARAAKPEAIRYRKLIDGIKDGLGWETALQEAYGLTPAQLVQAYGQSIGIPDLQP